jgi:hypothetical protein
MTENVTGEKRRTLLESGAEGTAEMDPCFDISELEVTRRSGKISEIERQVDPALSLAS